MTVRTEEGQVTDVTAQMTAPTGQQTDNTATRHILTINNPGTEPLKDKPLTIIKETTDRE